MHFLGLEVAGNILDWRECRRRPLQVGRIPATAAHDDVFAGIAHDHEFLGFTAAHGTRMGLNRQKLQAATFEDRPIGAVVGVVSRIESGLIDVETVGVLHHELAHAQ